MPGRRELSTGKGLRNLDVMRKQSPTAIIVILIIFIPNAGPRDGVEFYQWPYY